MKMIVGVMVGVSVLSFALGFYSRGVVELDTDTELAAYQTAPPELADSQAPTMRAVPDELSATLAEREPDAGAVAASESIGIPNLGQDQSALESEQLATRQLIERQDRDMRERRNREMLEDFFAIFAIGPSRAEQIVQELSDSESERSRELHSIVLRRIMDDPTYVPGNSVSLSDEEREFEIARREEEERRVFEEYYEAYDGYRKKYPHRSFVTQLSSRLQYPLNPAVKESLIQVMAEEESRSRAELRAARPGARNLDTPQGRGEMLEAMRNRQEMLASRNEGIKERAQPYLLATEFDQLVKSLDAELERSALTIRVLEIEQ